jgi:tetratricopeptide (TPR) repeat protein
LVRGDVDQALSLAQRAVVKLADDARAQAVLGMILLAKGHHAFARKALDNSLRLDPSSARVRRLALRAQLADNDIAAALASANRLTEFSEEDAPMLRRLTEGLIRAGKLDDTIALLDRALVRIPKDVGLIHAAAEARARSGKLDAAIALLAAYSTDDAHPSLWTHRLGLLARAARHDEAYELTARWRQVQPHEAEAHAEFATGAELRGEMELAREAADQALSLDPQQAKALTIATAYELKAGKPGPRYAALGALNIEQYSPTVKATRSFLLGFGADRIGDSDTAVRHWLDVQATLPNQRMPALADPLGPPRELPMPLPVTGEQRPLVLVPYLPGTGAEALLRALMRSESIVVLADRLSANGRHDGLSHDQRAQIENNLSESTLRLFRRRYWRAFDRLKLTPGRIPVDVLPSLEWVQYAALSGAIPQARVIAFVRDPRDTLLHWLAFGTTPARPIGKPELAANYLLRQYQHLDRMRSSAGLAVTVVRAEDFDSNRDALRERLAQALGVPPPSLTLEVPKRQSLGGLPDRLESGRWRQYAAPLGKAFRLLAPAARSFGYD